MNTNIYKFELRRTFLTSLIFALSVCAVVAFFVLAYYPILLSSEQEFRQMIESLPPMYLDAFGFDVDQMFSINGVMLFGYNFIGCIGAIMGLVIGMDIFSREKRSKCNDFVLTLPLSRGTIFWSKLACAASLWAGCAIVQVGLGLLFGLVAGGEDMGTFAVVLVGVVLLELVMTSVGILLGTALKRVRSVGGLATGVGLGLYGVRAVWQIIDQPALNTLSPLHYFAPGFVLEHGGFDPLLVVTSVLLVIGSVAASCWLFTTRDV